MKLSFAALLLFSAIAEISADGLDTRMKAKGKTYFGTCADSGTLSNTKNAKMIQSDCESLLFL